MLAITHALLALQLVLVAASPSPVDRAIADSDGISISLTKRQDLVSNGVANIQALLNALLSVRRKYESTMEAFHRNTGEKPPISFGVPEGEDDLFTNVTNRKRATGSVPLIDDQEVLWQGTISVGTPSVDYTVDFDTGSSDLFLPSSSCTSTSCQGHRTYNPALSSTSQSRSRRFSLSYGDGSTVQGYQYIDTVSAGGLTATNQVLGAATTYSDSLALEYFPPDGLLGMGFQAISQYNAPPLFQMLIAQKKTTQPVFAFKLATVGSELYLGGVNNALYTGSFTYVRVSRQAYWQVKLDSVSVNSKATAVRNIVSIIDTGTTLIVGDSSNVKRFYSQIPGSKDASSTVGPGYYTVPCNAIPTVQFTFGGKPFSIPPSIFSLGRVSATSSDCVGAIVNGGSQSFWVVGDVFIRTVYTVFDVGNARVGFATLR